MGADGGQDNGHVSDGIRDLPGWAHAYSGKVRDLYVPEGRSLDDTAVLLVVASDRVSAFDHVLRPDIPRKGVLLTSLTRWWFARLADVPNHLIGTDAGGTDADGADADDTDTGGAASEAPPVPPELAGRSMLVTPLRMFPLECVVRGYLAGSGWAEYRETQSVCGVALPAGLRNGDRLPEPIFTPAWKAPLGSHDENITFERSVELVGAEVAGALRELSLRVFAAASVIAERQGVILADTKFEFGAHPVTGTITLGDEVLTSDSSRFWDAAAYASGATPEERMASFDKQPVRDWLAANWDGAGRPPPLPAEVVRATADRYERLVTLLTS